MLLNCQHFGQKTTRNPQTGRPNLSAAIVRQRLQSGDRGISVQQEGFPSPRGKEKIG